MLRTKTFMTKDNNGCQFKCKAEYTTYDVFDCDKYETVTVKEAKYRAIGFCFPTLQELKDAISNIP